MPGRSRGSLPRRSRCSLRICGGVVHRAPRHSDGPRPATGHLPERLLARFQPVELDRYRHEDIARMADQNNQVTRQTNEQAALLEQLAANLQSKVSHFNV